MKNKSALEIVLDALKEAESHLDYCGYGDSWERECAAESKLADKIRAAIELGEKELAKGKPLKTP